MRILIFLTLAIEKSLSYQQQTGAYLGVKQQRSCSRCMHSHTTQQTGYKFPKIVITEAFSNRAAGMWIARSNHWGPYHDLSRSEWLDDTPAILAIVWKTTDYDQSIRRSETAKPHDWLAPSPVQSPHQQMGRARLLNFPLWIPYRAEFVSHRNQLHVVAPNSLCLSEFADDPT
mmetsp:Transcript_10007/g.20692  ORF Transcript_10007/g.20692 Transcript_10007/m.20692 type:complete len:173 (+) Transcript_10007:25-543(+)